MKAGSAAPVGQYSDLSFPPKHVLHVSLSLGGLVKPFKKPTMEGKSLVFAVAVDLIDDCIVNELVALLSLLFDVSERGLCIRL